MRALTESALFRELGLVVSGAVPLQKPCRAVFNEHFVSVLVNDGLTYAFPSGITPYDKFLDAIVVDINLTAG